MDYSAFCLLWITLLWTWLYKYLFKSLPSLLFNTYPEVEILDHMVTLCLILGRTPRLLNTKCFKKKKYIYIYIYICICINQREKKFILMRKSESVKWPDLLELWKSQIKAVRKWKKLSYWERECRGALSPEQILQPLDAGAGRKERWGQEGGEGDLWSACRGCS